MAKTIAPKVQDPGLRHLLRQVRRALLMVTAAIDAVCPEEEDRQQAA